MLMSLMRVLAVKSAKKVFPTGDPKFAVMQAFPAEFTTDEIDPFLMCDYFGPSKSKPSQDPDKFPVGWHPHRGMDICTYLKEGVGRHADSMGNRGEYATPGMQWISVGSGIEHAEGGGTPEDQSTSGFQIWVNVPATNKMDDPKYGTEPPENIPAFNVINGTALLLAGNCDGKVGPFAAKPSLQMIDFTVQPGSSFVHKLPEELDTCLLFVYSGRGKLAGVDAEMLNVIRMDASDPFKREIEVSTQDSAMSFMLFGGKRLNEPVAWQGPFVMNTQTEIQKTIAEYRTGQFPPKCVPWDYTKLADLNK
jgi:redox-sensitive bicupin YhaK (pirin superfamily)